MNPALITVFTPTYNRASLLANLYNSLKKQTNYSFIWLIIDDGSSDDTQEVVERFKRDNDLFEIRYVFKENGGLHTGYNKAIELLDTELAVCVDSDDWLVENAIELIINKWEYVRESGCAGIVALNCLPNGAVLGEKLPAQEFINLIDIKKGKYKSQNYDRKIIVRSDLYKEVAPQPTYNREKNFNPHYMHLLISKNYDFAVLNEPVCVVDYQPNGMSSYIFRQYYDSPNSFAELRLLYLSFEKTSLFFRARHSIHYVSSCILARRKIFERRACHKALIFLMIPIGFCLSRYIILKNRR